MASISPPAVAPCSHCGISNAPPRTIPRLNDVRVEELIRTNEPPRDQERTILEECVRGDTKMLSELDDEIAALDRAKGRALQRRRECSRNIQRHRGILQPVRRVPTEILRQIFLPTSQINDDPEELHSRWNSVDPEYAPWNIAQVSSQWRSVALSFPELWATIRISWHRRSIEGRGRRNWERLLGHQLHRSGAHPLSVSLLGAPGSDLPHNHPIFVLLLPTAPRWKQLFLWMGCSTFQALSRIQGFLTSLQTLYILPQNPDEASLLGIAQTFRFMPRLHTLVGMAEHVNNLGVSALRVYRPPHLTTDSNWPVMGIRFFLTQYSTTSDFLSLLRVAPDIEQISIICTKDGVAATIETRMSVRHLRSLSFSARDSDAIPQLLDGLMLPALEYLSIPGITDQTAPSLQGLINASNCSLQTLQLVFSNISLHICVNLLWSLPSLHTLIIDSPCVLNSHAFIGELHRFGQLLPSLRLLELRGFLDFPRANLTPLSHSRPNLQLITMVR